MLIKILSNTVNREVICGEGQIITVCGYSSRNLMRYVPLKIYGCKCICALGSIRNSERYLKFLACKVLCLAREGYVKRLEYRKLLSIGCCNGCGVENLLNRIQCSTVKRCISIEYLNVDA